MGYEEDYETMVWKRQLEKIFHIKVIESSLRRRTVDFQRQSSKNADEGQELGKSYSSLEAFEGWIETNAVFANRIEQVSENRYSENNSTF